MSACSLSRNSGLFLTLALPISEQMRGLAGPAGVVRAYSTLRVEVKSLPRAPELLIKEVTIPGLSCGRRIEISKNFPATSRRAGGQATGADGKQIPRFARE